MKLLKHGFEFFLMLVILIFAIILLGIFTGQVARFWIIVSLSIFYVLFGIFHHWEEKNLNLNQILEHAAIGFLIFVILYSLYH